MDAGTDEQSTNLLTADGLRKLVTEARARRASATAAEREPAAREFIAALMRFGDGAPDDMLAARALCLAAEETEDVLSQSDEAIELFQRALDKNPGLERAATQVEVLLQRLGKLEQRSELLLKRAARLNADSSSSEAARALAYRQAGAALMETGSDLNKILEVYERAAELDPEVDTLETLANLYERRAEPGDNEQAADILTSIAEALTGGEAINFAQRALDLLPDHDEAMSLLERLVPTNQHGRVLRGRLERYIERAGQDEDAYPRRVRLAEIYASQGKLKEALGCLSPAVQAGDPTAVEARRRLLEEGFAGGGKDGGTLVGVPLKETEGADDSDIAEALSRAGMDFDSETTQSSAPPPPPALESDARPEPDAYEGAAEAERAEAEVAPALTEVAPARAEVTQRGSTGASGGGGASAVDTSPPDLVADPAKGTTAAIGPSRSAPEDPPAPQEEAAETVVPQTPSEGEVPRRSPSGWPASAEVNTSPSEPARPSSTEAAWPALSSPPQPPTSSPAPASPAPASPSTQAASSIGPRGDLTSKPPPSERKSAGRITLAVVAAAVMALAMLITLLWPQEPKPEDPGEEPPIPVASPPERTAKGTTPSHDPTPEPVTAPAQGEIEEAAETDESPSDVVASVDQPEEASPPGTGGEARAGLSVEIAPARVMLAGAPINNKRFFAVLNDLQGDFVGCYGEARMRLPELRGRVVLLFLLNSQKPKAAHTIGGGTIKDVTLARCLANVVDAAPFPVPKQHQTRVRLPMELHGP